MKYKQLKEKVGQWLCQRLNQEQENLTEADSRVEIWSRKSKVRAEVAHEKKKMISLMVAEWSNMTREWEEQMRVEDVLEKEKKEMEADLEFVRQFRRVSIDINQTAKDKGWWDDRDALIKLALESDSPELAVYAQKAVMASLLALTHSEISEGLEGDRKDLMDDKIPGFTMLEAEMADVIIRIMDFSAHYRMKIPEAIKVKAEMNKGREWKHGKKF